MSIQMVILLFISWFLLGLSAGFTCSWIDCKYNNILHFDWKAAAKMSFLGLVLVVWTPFFFIRSKKDKDLRW